MNDEHREDPSATGWSSRSTGTSTAMAEPVDRRWFEEALRAQGFLVEVPAMDDEMSVPEPAPAAVASSSLGAAPEDTPRAVHDEPVAAVVETGPATGAGASEPWDLQPSKVAAAPGPEPLPVAHSNGAWPLASATPVRITGSPPPAMAVAPVSPATRQAVAPTTLPAGRPPVPTPELAARLSRSTTRPVPAVVGRTTPGLMTTTAVTAVGSPATGAESPSEDAAAEPAIPAGPASTVAPEASVAAVATVAPEAPVAPQASVATVATVAPEAPSVAPEPSVATVAAEPTVTAGAEPTPEHAVEAAAEPAAAMAATDTATPPVTTVKVADPWTLPALQADLAAERGTDPAIRGDDRAPFVVAAATAPVVAAASPADPGSSIASAIAATPVVDDPEASTAEATARQEADLQAQGVATELVTGPAVAPSSADEDVAPQAIVETTPAAEAGPNTDTTPAAEAWPDTDAASGPADDHAGTTAPTAVATSVSGAASPAAAPVAGIAAIAHRPPAAATGAETPVDGGASDLWGLVDDPRKGAAVATATTKPAASSRVTTLILTVFVAIVVVVLVLGFLYLLGQLL